jgi:hypothetical protein
MTSSETADIRSLQLLLSGETISIRRSQRDHLGIVKTNVWMNLSDLESSVLSVETLDSLLLSEFVRVKMRFCDLF